MDHFESLIATLLEADGYWVRRSFKVDVTNDEKRRAGKASMPRPEIDLLALDFRHNRVIAFEAKSYLDSPGVKLEHLAKRHDVAAGRYKLFTSKRHRDIVLGALHRQLIAQGMANSRTEIELGLAAGKVYRKQSDEVRAALEARGAIFWSPEEIREKVVALAKRGYENDPVVIAAKIALR